MHEGRIIKKAKELRRAGNSYNYIADATGLSKGTLYYWLSDIPFAPNKETIERIGFARARSGQIKSQQKAASIFAARKMARKDIGILNKRDLFMLGVGLYMGEGTKTHNIVRIINSDPKIIKLAIKWFTDVCGLSNKNFSIRLHLYPDNDIRASLHFWSSAIGLKKDQFQKAQIDTRKKKKVSKRGKLPYGTAHVTVKSNGQKQFGVFLARRINGWIEEVTK